MKKLNIKILIICLISVYAIAFLGSLFTSPNTNTEWYESIKPSITPPSYVFPIVWNILFFMIAISLYLSYTSSKNKEQKNKVITVFTINLILNLLWSFLYFSLKNPLLAFADLILIWFTIILMIKTTYKINKTSSYLLSPYFPWVSFAGVLNYLTIL